MAIQSLWETQTSMYQRPMKVLRTNLVPRTSDPRVGGSNPSGRATFRRGFRAYPASPNGRLTPRFDSPNGRRGGVSQSVRHPPRVTLGDEDDDTRDDVVGPGSGRGGRGRQGRTMLQEMIVFMWRGDE